MSDTAPPPPDLDLRAVNAALEKHFGFRGLRPGQADALAPVLGGRDTLVVMPTGAGKSLIFQLAALMQPSGVTVVVSPLIALMKDQVDALRARGIAAAYVNSSQSMDEQREVLDDLRAGRLQMVYAAPERLRLASFQRSLVEANVNLLAVDEAHCVSQWGHDFRPDYLNIASAREAMGTPPCVALTATATGRVQDDIASQLRLSDPARLVTGFNRPNLFFDVRSTATAKLKESALKQFLDERRGQAGLIYVATRKEATKLSAFISNDVGRPCEMYHAGLPDHERSDVQNRFIGGTLDLVVATNAFGMGVDRGDVRFVAHWSIPPNIESYYQEAGRAGRDGNPATAVLFYAPQDRSLREWFIEQQAPTQAEMRGVFDAIERIERTRKDDADDERDFSSATDAERQFETLLSDRVGVHGSKARVILSLLRRSGALAERENRIGAARWSKAKWDTKAVQNVLGRSDLHRDGKAADLSGIVAYAQTGECRRRVILDHFGDPAETNVEASQCCDACRSRGRLRSAPGSIPEWSELTMDARVAIGLLDAVRKMKWPVGRITMAKILAGSSAKGMERYTSHPYYGRLATVGQSEIDRRYKQLLLEGYLRIGGAEFPVVEITPVGEQAVDHREVIDLGEVPTASRQRKSASRSEEVILDADDEALFERLRAWRSSQALDRNVPAFTVLNDRTLRALATVRPSTNEALLSVTGIGPGKAGLYGRELLALIGS